MPDAGNPGSDVEVGLDSLELVTGEGQVGLGPVEREVEEGPGTCRRPGAALTSAALSLAQRLAREAGQGTLREALTRSTGGYVAIYAVGAAAVLVLLGDEGLDITRLHRESRSVVDNIEKLLA